MDAPSRWRPGPRRVARLIIGLGVFGAGEALVVAAELGNSPWTVLAEGIEAQSALSIGVATVAVSFAVLVLWIPLRQRPGLGTLANALLVGLALDATLLLLPALETLGARIGALVVGIGLVGVGSGLYLARRSDRGPATA